MRKMAGASDGFEACTRYRCAIGASVSFRDNTVAGSPQEQRRNADTVQPGFEFWVVHIGRPSVARGGFPVACHESNVGVRHGLVITVGTFRLKISELVELCFGDGEDVGDVAALAIAVLDTDGIGE